MLSRQKSVMAVTRNLTSVTATATSTHTIPASGIQPARKSNAPSSLAPWSGSFRSLMVSPLQSEFHSSISDWQNLGHMPVLCCGGDWKLPFLLLHIPWHFYGGRGWVAMNLTNVLYTWWRSLTHQKKITRRWKRRWMKELGWLAHRRDDRGEHHGCLQRVREVLQRRISLFQYGCRDKSCSHDVPCNDSGFTKI